MADCSLPAYLRMFQEEYTTCLNQNYSNEPMERMGFCAGQAAVRTFRIMNHLCTRMSGPSVCTPQGYFAVLTKEDPTKKLYKVTLNRVPYKLAEKLVNPSKIGCTVGSLVGGIFGGLVGRNPQSVSLGAVFGCQVGSKIAIATHNSYQVVVKISEKVATAKQIYKNLKQLQGHSDRCKVVPYDLLASNTHTFIEGVQQNGLADSYNSSNPDAPIAENGASDGEIGGVGNNVGMIEGLFDTYNAQQEKQHVFFVPSTDGKLPFTSEELYQIAVEVATCEYVEETTAFVSIHFNADGNLYTVMHPALRRTLIGAKVIGPLDYLLKQFLNGVRYRPGFVEEWQKTKTQDPNILKANCSDLQSYCQKHLPGQSYFSIPELIDILKRTDAKDKTLSDQQAAEAPIFSDYSGFRSSFRLIAEQNSIRKEGNGFILDGKVNAFYTIEPDPVYAEELKKYRLQFGHDPVGYQRLVKSYEAMKFQIETVMPLLPECRDLFEMLKVINFFSYYFRTLKHHQKVPVFENRQGTSYSFPDLLPSLPLRKTHRQNLEIDLEKVFEKLSTVDKKAADTWVLEFAQDRLKKITELRSAQSPITPEQQQELAEIKIPQAILKIVEEAFKKILQEKTYPPIPEEQLAQYNYLNLLEEFLSALIAKTVRYLSIKKMQETLSQQREEIQQAQTIITQATAYLQQLRAKKAEAEGGRGKFTQESINQVLGKVLPAIQSTEQDLQEFQQQLTLMTEHETILANNLKEALQAQASSSQENPVLEEPIKNLCQSTTLAYPIIQLFSELPEEERHQNKKIVGGCGLSLHALPVTADPRALEILKQSFTDLQLAQEGTFVPVKLQANGKVEGYAFKLSFKNSSATNKQDHAWMQFQNVREDIDTTLLKAEMFSAIQEGDLRGFKDNLQNKANLVIKDARGTSLTHYAAVAKKPEYLQELIQGGADLTVQDTFGYTPLHYAAKEGALWAIELILKKCPALLNAQGHDQATPLYLAVQHNQLKAVELLLKYGPENQLPSINTRTAHGMTPLYCAIHHQHSSIALELLKRKDIDVNGALEDGTTPVYTAVVLEMFDVVKSLTARGADLNRCRIDSMAPLHIAAKNGSIAMCELLLTQVGIQPNLPLKSGRTALHLAVEYNVPQIVQSLLTYGADPKVLGWDGETALLTAIRQGNKQAVEFLMATSQQIVKEQALINLPNLIGETPLQVTLDSRFYGILEILLKNNIALPEPKKLISQLCKAKVDPLLIHQVIQTSGLQREDLQNAYSMAFSSGHNQMVSLFQKFYGLQELCTKGSWTAARYAAMYDHVDVVRPFVKTMPKNDPEIGALAQIAAAYGSPRCLEILLKSLSSFNPVLLKAVKAGRHKCVDLVIRHMQHPNVPLDVKKNYAIHIAAKNGDVEMLELLRLRGADFTVRDQEGKTAFHYAFEYQWKDAIHFLLDIKNELAIPEDLLWYIAGKGTPRQIRKLVKKQCHPNVLSTQANAYPIFHAIQEGKLANLLALMSYGANLNVSLLNQETPLLLAARLGKVDILKCVLEKAAIKQPQTKKQETLCHLVAQCGDEESASYLMSQGFNPSIRDEQGQTAIDIAHKKGFSNLALIFQKKDHELQEIKAAVVDALKAGDEKAFFHEIQFLPLNQTMQFTIDKTVYSFPLLHLIYHFSLKQEAAQKIFDRLIEFKGVDKYVCDQKGRTVFHRMARHGKLTAFKELDLSKQDFRGASILHYYAAHVKPNEWKHLLDKCSWINLEDKDGLTLLHYAIGNENAEAIQVLLEKGANPNDLSRQRLSPLMAAIERGLPAVVDQLLNYWANPNQSCLEHQKTALHFAIEKKSEQIVKLLIRQGADVNQPDLDGVCPIHLAAQLGSLPMLRLLESAGASFHIKDHEGRTAMHYAAESNQVAVLQFLKEKGLSLDKQTKVVQPSIRKSRKQIQGLAPIHLAAKKGHLKTLRWLIEQKVNVHALVEERLGILFYAAYSGNVELLSWLNDQRLIKESQQKAVAIQGAIVRDAVQELDVFYAKNDAADFRLDDQGTTALELAASVGARKCARYLLHKGANPYHANLKGETPFDIAVRSHHLALARRFAKVSKGLDIHRKLKEGKTYLHLSVMSADTEMAAWLIERGINIDEKDSHGLTALHYAAKQASYSLLSLLLACGADTNKKSGGGKTPIESLPSEAIVLKNLMLNYQQLHLKRKEQEESCLQLAIRQKDMHHLPLLMQINPLNHANSKGETALHLAVRNNLQAAQQLIQMNADLLTIKDGQGRTPLFLAIWENSSFEIIQSLLKLGSEVRTENVEGETLLYTVIKRYTASYRSQLFGLICKAVFDGLKPTVETEEAQNQLEVALHQNDIKAFFRWIHLGVFLSNGILNKMVSYQAVDVIDTFLTWFKIESYMQEKDGKSLFTLAYELNNKKMFDVLLKHVKKINSNSTSTTIPEILFQQDQLCAFFHSITESNSDLKTVATNGDSWLHFAVKKNSMRIAQFFLWYGLDMHARNNLGNTPLHTASALHHLEMVKLLLDGQADVHVLNKKGQTPFSVSLSQSLDPQLVELFRNSKVDFNWVDQEGFSQTQRAVLNNDAEVLKGLLQVGARLRPFDLKDDNHSEIALILQAGYTPLLKIICDDVCANQAADLLNDLSQLYLYALKNDRASLKELLEQYPLIVQKQTLES